MPIPDELEDVWADFARSLRRRDRSPSTIQVYRKSFDQFWTWATDDGIAPDPAVIDHTVINRWTDYLLTAPAIRNGRPVLKPDPATGELPLEPSTRRIRYAHGLRRKKRPGTKTEALPRDCSGDGVVRTLARRAVITSRLSHSLGAFETT